jgi:hypothetical protein
MITKPQRWRRSVGLGVVVVVLSLVGCSEDGALPPQPRPVASSTPPIVVDLTADVLLTPDDLPAGFAVSSTSPGVALDVLTPYLEVSESLRPGCEPVRDRLAVALTDLPSGALGVVMSRDQVSLAEVVVPVSSDEQAAQLVADLGEYVAACDVSAVQVPDRGSVSIVLTPLDVGADDVVAWSRTFIVDTQSRVDTLVAGVRGDVVVLLGVTGASTLPLADLEPVVTTALQRAEAAQ